MEWTKLQSKTWHCRKNAWPSSFIKLIEEINSRLYVPWLPLAPLRGVLHGKPSSSPFCHHGVSGIWNTRIWDEEANAAARKRESFARANKRESQILDESEPLLQYLLDVLEGSVALWNRNMLHLRGIRICFSGFYLSLGFMQCLDYLLILSIKVPVSLHLSC